MSLPVFYQYLFIGFSVASLGFMLWTNFRVWKAHKRVMKREEEYGEALGKAIAAIRDNPERWLDYHKAMDDKRRMN